MEFKIEQLYFERLGYEKRVHYYQPNGEVGMSVRTLLHHRYLTCLKRSNQNE